MRGECEIVLFASLFYSTFTFTHQFFIFLFFLAFDFGRFCMVIRFFHPRHNLANDLRLWRISIPDLIHFIYFPILILKKEPVSRTLKISKRKKKLPLQWNITMHSKKIRRSQSWRWDCGAEQQSSVRPGHDVRGNSAGGVKCHQSYRAMYESTERRGCHGNSRDLSAAP